MYVCQIHIIIYYAFECKNLGFVLIRSNGVGILLNMSWKILSLQCKLL